MKPSLPPFGVWTMQLDNISVADACAAAVHLEDIGVETLWIPEYAGRDPFVFATLLLAATSRVRIATGVAGIWSRDPMAMTAAHRSIAEAFPDRFILGLGVSHRPIVQGIRGHHFEKPLQTMRNYLAAMDAAKYLAPPSASAPVRVIGALGPAMLELAREHACGAHPLFVTPEHTRRAREILGPTSLLAPEQLAVLASTREDARVACQWQISAHLALPNYANNLRRLGFSERDLENGGSDRLFDATVGWGDTAAIAERVHEHLEAGADHVAIQLLTAGSDSPSLPEWESLWDTLCSQHVDRRKEGP
jgi:probable F420-dependent oxidoreductase